MSHRSLHIQVTLTAKTADDANEWIVWCIDIVFWCMLCKSNYGFLECILLPVCSHAIHVFHDICVVRCIFVLTWTKVYGGPFRCTNTIDCINTLACGS